MSFPTDSIVQFYNPRRQQAGMGLLVAPDYVLTCAHVVNAALGRSDYEQTVPESEITASLSLVGSGPSVTGKVSFWRPARKQDKSSHHILDVAVIRLNAPAPSAGHPLELTHLVMGNKVKVYGSPLGYIRGRYTTAEIQGNIPGGLIQLFADNPNGPISQGFSGTPVYDTESDQVVGLIHGIEPTDPLLSYMIPVGPLLNAYNMGRSVEDEGFLALQSEEYVIEKRTARETPRTLPNGGEFVSKVLTSIKARVANVPADKQVWADVHLFARSETPFRSRLIFLSYSVEGIQGIPREGENWEYFVGNGVPHQRPIDLSSEDFDSRDVDRVDFQVYYTPGDRPDVYKAQVERCYIASDVDQLRSTAPPISGLLQERVSAALGKKREEVNPEDYLLVTRLDLSRIGSEVDLTPLIRLVNLSDLDMQDTCNLDLYPLQFLRNLKKLILDRSKVTDFGFLRHLIRLDYLALTATQITDLTPLERLVNLESLYLGETKVSSLEPLANLHRLKALILNDITTLSSLKGLESLAQIATLHLDRLQRVEDYGVLESLVNLRHLTINGAGRTIHVPLLREDVIFDHTETEIL